MSQKIEQESGRRVRRMLQMILLLQESRSRSSAELADQFEVSKRTIFRDMQLLRDTGFPVSCDGKGNYELEVRLVQHMELSPLELIALAGTENGPGIVGVPFLRTARDLALAKLTAAGSTLTQAQIQQVREQLSDLLTQTAGEDLDEATVEALIESWIAEAKK